uniref:Dihydroorotase n=1 Tax=Anthurium amnicola TaxID=1678845 RepID=A0A1D1Y9L1_9ARAE
MGSCLFTPTMAASLLRGLTSSCRCPSRPSHTGTTPRLDHTASGRRSPWRRMTTRARLGGSADGDQQQQQQLNFSVLRFTLGIPGLDESYLPRYIGLVFGSLVVLNHFLGSSDSPTPTQLRSEALGVCLAGFSFALPYFGKFLKGASPVDHSFVPEGNIQIFVMSDDITDIHKEDFAWGTYVLLRNTNTMSVLISVGDALCIRGYWNIPEDASKAHMLDSFHTQIQQTGLSDLKDTLYFPQGVDSQFLGILPQGTLSVLLQPVFGAYNPNSDRTGEAQGFILLASSSSYAYRDSDRAWIKAVANKFQGINNACANAIVMETSS